MKLKAPIGIDNFKKLIDQNYLYVDKTLFVEEFLNTSAEVQLITRPRRFGKTIGLSMLRYFFDNRLENSGELFRGLAIEKRPCFQRQGQSPVISITFKNLKASRYELFLSLFAEMMAEVFGEYEYLFDGLKPSDQKNFRKIIDEEAPEGKLIGSLAFLMRLLEDHHGRKVILLLDEYDSPIHEGYDKGYYEEVVDFMRPFLGKALKGNDALEKAVITGILRVAKESIFSDLNNLKVFTLLDASFSKQFGFTNSEVTDLLEKAGRGDQQEQVDQWYNGYLVGETVIYNPWSILNFLDDQTAQFQPYWVNTSANSLIREQVLKAPPGIHDQLHVLMLGGTIETLIQQHMSFRDLTANAKTLWSFFLFGGYLKVSEKTFRNNEFYYRLAIPNLEVGLLFNHIITDWLNDNYGDNRLGSLLNSLIVGNFEDFQTLLAGLVQSVLSYYDTDTRYAERVYHAFVLGLVVHLNHRYEIRSNREAGLGRYDLLMRPRNPEDRGIIMEFKAAENPDAMEAGLDAAEAQMQKRAYGADLEQAGVKLRSEIAVVFCGKQVAIRGRQVALE